MTNHKKRIIRLLVTVLLLVSTMLSLSSCLLLDFGFSYGDYLPDFNQGDDQQNPFLPDTGNNNNNDNIESENYGDFYPGSGQGEGELTPFAKTMLSTVTIICTANLSGSAGSGVIYSIDKEKGDAYIVTNQHVVHNASIIEVYLYGMQLSAYAIPATYVGGSVTYDVAVIKISGSEVLKNSYACAASFADSDEVRVFDKVYAVGNPEGSGLSATEGIVSVESENISITGADNSLISMRVMRIDAAVNHGNSGGGLYDADGKLVGIVSAKEVSEDIDNMGYAIPSNLVKSVANSILTQCNGSTVTKINKALMGVTITAYVSGLEIDDGGDVYQVELVEVIEISAGSLADGKVLVGDIINSITVDGVTKKTTRIHHVTDAMIDARNGSVVVLNITRDGKQMDITFNITEANLSVVK